MTLHLVKVCVGATGVDSLARWQSGEHFCSGDGFAPYHDTRMFPRRAEEVLAGGSLYWTIHSHYAVRQCITNLEPITAHDGTKKCRIWLDPELVTVRSTPRRPFQGWRYLPAEDAPPDMAAVNDDSQDLIHALSQLGLL